MHPKLTDAIKKMTLTARELLMREVSEQLEGIYGFLPDGTLKPKEQYPAFQNNNEAAETRRQIEEFVANEKLAGLNAKKHGKNLGARQPLPGLTALWPLRCLRHESSCGRPSPVLSTQMASSSGLPNQGMSLSMKITTKGTCPRMSLAKAQGRGLIGVLSLPNAPSLLKKSACSLIPMPSQAGFFPVQGY